MTQVKSSRYLLCCALASWSKAKTKTEANKEKKLLKLLFLHLICWLPVFATTLYNFQIASIWIIKFNVHVVFLSEKQCSEKSKITEINSEDSRERFQAGRSYFDGAVDRAARRSTAIDKWILYKEK